MDSSLNGTRSVDPSRLNVLSYYGRDGGLYGDGKTGFKKEGSGFKEGDKVTVSMGMETGVVIWLVIWLVNGIKQAGHKMDRIIHTNIDWVPYI